MTSRFPITSTTMVVIRTLARRVTTQGKDWCSSPGGPSCSVPTAAADAGVALRGPMIPPTMAMVGSWSSRDISCAKCRGSTSRIGCWTRIVAPCIITHRHGRSGQSAQRSYCAHRCAPWHHNGSFIRWRFKTGHFFFLFLYSLVFLLLFLLNETIGGTLFLDHLQETVVRD